VLFELFGVILPTIYSLKKDVSFKKKKTHMFLTTNYICYEINLKIYFLSS